jgi:hypothetical protein
MHIKEEVNIILNPDEVKDILKKYFSNEYKIEDVYFNIDGVQDPADWRAELPLSYEMTKVKLIGQKINENDKPRKVPSNY